MCDEGQGEGEGERGSVESVCLFFFFNSVFSLHTVVKVMPCIHVRASVADLGREDQYQILYHHVREQLLALPLPERRRENNTSTPTDRCRRC